MQFGLTLPNRGVLFGATTPDEMLQTAEIADQSGAFQSVWVGDSLFGKPRMEAVTLLAGVAARTRRVPGTLACQVPEVHVVCGQRLPPIDLIAAVQRRPEGRSTL